MSHKVQLHCLCEDDFVFVWQHRHGYSVEFDDFGTGHVAIATLRKCSVSRIKTDRSLVQDIDTDAELRVITSAIINLAKQLGIKALSEGVKTIEE